MMSADVESETTIADIEEITTFASKNGVDLKFTTNPTRGYRGVAVSKKDPENILGYIEGFIRPAGKVLHAVVVGISVFSIVHLPYSVALCRCVSFGMQNAPWSARGVGRVILTVARLSVSLSLCVCVCVPTGGALPVATSDPPVCTARASQ